MRGAKALLMVGLLVVLEGTAEAVIVKNITTNTVLFSDDFESLTPVSTLPAVDASDDYDPIAAVGTWNVYEDPGEAGSSAEIQVTSSTAAPDPGPFQGANYLRIFRDGNIPLAGHDLNGLFTADQTNPGDVIRMSTMIYVPNDGNNARGQFFLLGTPSDILSARAWVRPNGAGDVIAVGPDFALTDTGINYTPGVWQQWDMEYAVGGSTFSVTVAGATASGFTSFASGNVATTLFINGNNTAGSIYFDAVPTTPTLMPDVNMDGVVNIFDINLVSSNWGGPGPTGDANKDGIVNIFDINLISANWTPASGGSAAVPEPASAILLVVGAALLAVNRRRCWR